MFPEFIAPRALRAPIDDFVGNIVSNYSEVLRAFTQPLLDLLIWMDQVVRYSPWWTVVLAVMALAWFASRRIGFSAIIGLMLCLIGFIGLWDAAMQTLSLMIVAVLMSVAIGIPVGILMASFKWLRTIMLPILDV